MNSKKKIIVLGSSGMIGHMICKFIKKSNTYILHNLSGSRKFDAQTTIIDAQYFDKIKAYRDEWGA